MKGQTAVEYLMTYGWAILIILIVAGVLAYYGIFAPSSFLAPTASGFGNLMVRTPWSLTTGGALTLDIENRVGQTINVTEIFVTVGSWSGNCLNPTGLSNLASGSHNATQCTLSGAPITGATAGSTYNAQVAIQYIPSGTTYSFNSSGTISGKY